MFAGHIGAGLALARMERRVNVGVFIASALLLDIVLWILVLLGRESIVLPEDFARTRQPSFTFPFSHGLLASLLWAALAALAVFAFGSRLGASRARAALLVGTAAFSHWSLDALVHRSELPVAGALNAGLGLWDQLPLALGVETGILFFGMGAFLTGSDLPRGRSIGMAAVALLTLALTLTGMTVAPPPPSAFAMASSSLVTLAVVCAVSSWLGRRPRTQPA